MIGTRPLWVLAMLGVALVGCEDEVVTSVPSKTKTTKDKGGKNKPSAKNEAKGKQPAASASAAKPTSKPPEKLAGGLGLGEVLALDGEHLYWTTRAGANCSGPPGSCKSTSDGTIRRIAKAGGIEKEVVGSLHNVSSIAFDDEHVLWTMCGSVDYVQRCQVTRVPKKGGKREVVFDAGPGLVNSVGYHADRTFWVEPGKDRIRYRGKAAKPDTLVEAGDVTEVLPWDDAAYWLEGRAPTEDGVIKKRPMRSVGKVGDDEKAGGDDEKAGGDDEKAGGDEKGSKEAEGGIVELASKRRSPRHLAADDTHVYWVETAETKDGKQDMVVMRVANGGGEPKRIVGDLSFVEDIAVAGERVVIATSDAVVWVPRGGGKSHVVASGLESPHGPAADETHAYWIADNKVWRAELPK